MAKIFRQFLLLICRAVKPESVQSGTEVAAKPGDMPPGQAGRIQNRLDKDRRFHAHLQPGQFASNTARAKPIGVALRRFALSGEGGSRCILLPCTGSSRLGGGMMKPPPVQRQVFLVYRSFSPPG